MNPTTPQGETTSYDDVIVRFAAALANQRQVDLDTLHPHARIIMTGPFATNNPESYSPVLNEWLLMADAAALSLPRTAENIAIVKRILSDFVAFVFSTPGYIPTEIPDRFHEHPMGRIWDMARLWVEQDNLIGIGEAASLAGVSIAAISQNKKLTTYVNPLANGKQQHRRLVNRAEVVQHYGVCCD